MKYFDENQCEKAASMVMAKAEERASRLSKDREGDITCVVVYFDKTFISRNYQTAELENTPRCNIEIHVNQANNTSKYSLLQENSRESSLAAVIEEEEDGIITTSQTALTSKREVVLS